MRVLITTLVVVTGLLLMVAAPLIGERISNVGVQLPQWKGATKPPVQRVFSSQQVVKGLTRLGLFCLLVSVVIWLKWPGND